MCLLITQSEQSPKLSNAWLEDFYDYNGDGVGVMFVENGSLIIEKCLPKNAAQFVSFYRAHIEGKNCAFHLRMRTHGATDLENCHPYEVLNRKDHGMDLWLMHNGILSTGNAADVTKSDTWHYIRDYLRPMLAANPDFAFHPAFAAIVGEHIGASTKFVLMDDAGRLAVVNQKSGVYWAGLWLSNTYAWTASSNAAKTPIKGYKKQLKQATERPEIRAYKYANYGYGKTAIGYVDGNEYEYEYEDGGDNVRDHYDDIASILDEIEIANMEKAGNISVSACMEFVEQFGLESFYEVSYMLLDGNIGEDWYVKIMTDDVAAREAFPWLERAAYANTGREYAD